MTSQECLRAEAMRDDPPQPPRLGMLETGDPMNLRLLRVCEILVPA